MPYRRPRIAIVGAGSSGLVTLKSLLAAQLDVTCFEQGWDVGGLWVRGNSNGRKGVYDSLQMNSSRLKSQFSDFPMPESWGHYPDHGQMARYFDDYAEHFRLRHHIRFGTRVEGCVPLIDGGYEITFAQNKGSQRFDALVVANGHHFLPNMPESSRYAGFEGRVLHSYDYVNPSEPQELTNQRILVVGMGNSAMDIACELSQRGRSEVFVSARRGTWVLPKFLRGRPIDQGRVFPYFLPAKLRRRLVTRSFEWLHGKMSDFGLPEPDHLIGEAHPTLSGEFPELVKSGRLHIVGGFDRAEGQSVTLNNGEQLAVDAVVFCTGYRIHFPFLPAEHVEVQDNQLDLYFRLFHPEHRHLFFVGLMQTIGAVMPVVEQQAQALAQHLSGRYNLPQAPQMRAAIRLHEEALRERFVPSLRHTMQVIPELFRPALTRELRVGQKRAKRGEGQAFSLGKHVQ